MAGTRAQTARGSQATGKKRGKGEKTTRPKKKPKNKPRKQSRELSSPNPDASDSDDSDNGPKSDSPIELTPPPIIPDYRNYCVGGLGQMFSLEEVNYTSAIEQSEEEVHNALTDTDIEIHLVSSIASMKAYRTQPITNDVAKAEHWRRVKDLIKEAYVEGKTGLRVDWDLKYRRGGRKGTHAGSLESATNVPPSSQQTPASQISNVAPSSSGRRTTTDRLVAQAEERERQRPENHTKAIFTRWVCNRKGCRNHSHHCFVDSINDDRHLVLSPNDTAKWNIQIQLGKATVEIPPDAVRKNMEAKTPEHDSRPHANFRKHTQSSGSTIIHNYLHMPPASSNHSHHSRHTNTLESSPFSSPSLPQSSRRSNRSTLRSSPIPTDSDPDKMIEEYIQWHIDRTPGHRANLIEAKQKLLNEAMTLQTLHDSTASEIRDIGIELGIAKRLVKEVRQFAHLMREKKERELGELIDVDDQN